MNIRFHLIILLSCWVLALSAQDNQELQRRVYYEAEENYQLGLINEARQQLTDHIAHFEGTLQQSAYRLLALCCLGMDEEKGAEEYVSQLLMANPYYSPTAADPQRFIDMVERLKAGQSTTITTASSKAEKLSEVPVPTTLITEEMIRDCGGRNLQEVLAAYVPGMTIVDCNNDINLAMRGIYSTGQEKMLILLNGHRLNSYSTNIAAPDFSMSLEKIKQIEVLRGPASSLYGGVALTAVINIITKQGADINGIKVRGAAGSYNTFRGDVLFGKRYFDLDLFIWASIYKSKGQTVSYDPSSYDLTDYNDLSPEEINPFLQNILFEKKKGDITIGAIGSKPSFDVGINMKWKGIQFLYNTRFSQIISPFTMSYLYAPYDIDRYPTYNGIKPSFTTLTHHAEVSYSKEIGRLFLKGSLSYDNNDLTQYQVISDNKNPLLPMLLQLPDYLQTQMADKEGLSRYINGQEQAVGGQLKADYNYMSSLAHKGYLSLGVEMNHFMLDDARYVLGHSFTSRVPETTTIADVAKGHETSFNLLAQLKHQWGPFIVNAGVRYDTKQRYDNSRLNELSPRMALIYVQPKWNVKLSYSKAFIEAPYLYRKTNSFMAALTQVERPELQAESFHAYQLSFAGTQWLKGFDFEVNGFFNRARDLIYLQIIDHKNTGNTDTWGVELVGKYTSAKFSANLSAAWQKLSKSTIFNYNVNQAFNIPELSANLVLTWQPVQRLRVSTHLTYYSRQTAYSIDLINAIVQRELASAKTPEQKASLTEVYATLLKRENGAAIQFIDVAPRFLVNLNASYELLRNLEIGINIHNLLDKEYYQSGMATGIIRQQGRWILGSVSYKF